jgi:uncharacterized protein (TIGR03437 family)
MGDIILSCSGGTPGAVVSGGITISLNAPITNRLTAGTASDLVVTIDTGAGPQPGAVTAISSGAVNVILTGIQFTTPATGSTTIRIDNLRASMIGLAANQPVTAFLALNGLSTLALQNNMPTLAIGQRGLLTNSSSTQIRCVGSPLPTTIDMTNLFLAGTHFESTRLTEGFPTAFQARGSSLETAGTRFLIRYTNLPAGVVLYAPNAVAGSNAAQPTAGGDLGAPQALGSYVTGSHTLLLGMVQGADANGNGGTTVPLNFNSVTQLPIAGGSASLVYEVLDSNPTVTENAQFPVFVGIPTTASAGVAQEAVSFAPVSTDTTANSSAPIPRFTAIAPPSDCQVLQDCNASYFPALFVPSPPSIQFAAIAGGLPLGFPGYIAVQNVNAATSILNWTATATYQNGSGWLSLSPSFGLNNGTVRVDALSQNLAPGTYNATITIDAGVAGNKRILVTLIVTALPPVTTPPVTTPPVTTPPVTPPNVTPTVTSVTNGASLVEGPLVQGSIAIIKGAKFSGKTVAVAFDGVTAQVLAAFSDSINVLVPNGLDGKTSAKLVVTVDGNASAGTTVSLATVAPGIFANGILNADGTQNNATNGSVTGTPVSILVTGLAQTNGTVLVKIHDRDDLVPSSAGPLDGNPGVQVVVVTVPDDLPSMTTTALVCGVDANGAKVCSPPAPITLTAASQ